MTRTAAYILTVMGAITLLVGLIVPLPLVMSILAVAAIAIGLFAIAQGVLRMKSSFFVSNLCEIPNTKRWVALTFDDGPHPETNRLLDTLDNYQVKATFFCIGKEAEEYPTTLLRIANSGHSIGTHTYNHSWKYTLESAEQVSAEIASGTEAIAKIIGKKPILFRPPFGVTNPTIGQAIRANGLQSVGWNIRTFDTTTNNGSTILKRISKQLKPGAIILMHDRLKVTVDTLPLILDEIKKQGLTPVSLEEALNSPIYV